MHISYNRLWQTLAQKDLKKTDLIELAGVSSRTLAKLSANQSVTVDTLARICEALNCGIEDVISVSEEYSPLSLYDAFKNCATRVGESDYFTLWSLSYAGRTFNVFVSKAKANKLTVISCENDCLAWYTMPFNVRLNGQFYGQLTLQFKERVAPQKGIISVYVIDGKPQEIRNLDDGIFRSARHPGDDRFVHVMSMARFRTFEVPDEK